MSEPHSLVEDLSKLITLTNDILTKAGVAERVETIRELNNVGEYKLAAEILCSNLYEFDCPIPSAIYALLKVTCTKLELEERHWQVLEAQVIK